MTDLDRERLAEALAMVDQGRRDAADRLVTPWWYHPALGAGCAGWVAAWSLGSGPWPVLATFAFVAGVCALAWAYWRINGVWVHGFAHRATLPWAIATGVVLAAASIAGLLINEGSLARGWLWPILVLVAVAVPVLGLRFDIALRADLRNGR